jgi:hypothetical protein
MDSKLNLTAIPERDALVLMVCKIDVLLKNISNRYSDELLKPFDVLLLAIKKPDSIIIWTKEWRDFEEKIIENAGLSAKIDKSKSDILSAQLELKKSSSQINHTYELIKKLFELSELINNRVKIVDDKILAISSKLDSKVHDEDLTKLKRDLEAYKSIRGVFLQVIPQIFEADKVFKKALSVFFEVLYVDEEKYEAALVKHKSIDEFVDYVNAMCERSVNYIGYQSKALEKYTEITEKVDLMCNEQIKLIEKMLEQEF